ncbi:MAG: ATP12 family protein [Pseudomonadota bacterium]|nr:ATP12 family protein [Pseudomonadota bacterium]
MKRFYATVATAPAGDGHQVLLDGRPIRSPARRPVILPSAALASAIAAEWEAQGEKIDPKSMPLMRMAGTAIDELAGMRAQTADAVARYGATDMVCYWSDRPQKLLERQQATWRPLLDWLEQRFGARLAVTTDLRALEQPPEALARLHQVVHGLDDFRLVPLSVATGTAGSLVIGLALLEGRLDAAGAFEAAQLDESHQIEEWGEDHEATVRREGIMAEFSAVERFVRALQGR